MRDSRIFILLLLILVFNVQGTARVVAIVAPGARPVKDDSPHIQFGRIKVIEDPAAFIAQRCDTAKLPDMFNFKGAQKGKTVWLLGFLSVPDSLLGTLASLKVSETGFTRVFISGLQVYSSANASLNEEEDSFSRNGQYGKYLFFKPRTHSIPILCQFTCTDLQFYFNLREMNIKQEFFSQRNTHYENYFTLACAFILFSLGLMFFFLFLYAKDLYNLYFALFSFSVSGVILYPIAVMVRFATRSDVVLVSLISAITLFLILFLKNFIALKTRKAGKVLFGLVIASAVTTIALSFFSDPGFGKKPFLFPLICLLLLGSAEVVRIIIRGVIEKKRQAYITGVGVLLSLFTFLGTAFYDVFAQTVSWNGAFNYQTVLFAISGSLFPFFMALNLAGDFSRKNKLLAEQVQTIRDLSEKNLQKEKEKQEIMLMQNERLELQVQERTREITLQKELIEAKQKEIIDSIHYARRIQKALITSEKYISRRLGRMIN